MKQSEQLFSYTAVILGDYFGTNGERTGPRPKCLRQTTTTVIIKKVLIWMLIIIFSP